MELKDCRRRIDEINSEMERLFLERMEISLDVAAYKQEHHLPTFDPAREREILRRAREKAPAGLAPYVSHLFQQLMEMGRSYQNRSVPRVETLTGQIRAALENTPKLFPGSAAVACQGVEGAYSQLACDRLFKLPNVFYFSNFEAVFSAIEKGLCQYGVIPVENSTAGSVNAVYDLMMRHDFRIVRSLRLKVDHNLLANPGAKLSDIREICSHEQAIAQCSAFLQEHPEITVVRCENTAAAAKRVAQSGRKDVAALSSRSCAELYGLTCLASNVQDQGNNFTRFICISKNLEIYPGADRTSLMMVLPHRPGSLYKVLSRFYALGINLNKLESRPMPERNFEFMFYFDLETSVYTPQFQQLMAELPSLCEEFSYLGSYSEVV